MTIHPCIPWAITYIDEHLDERLSLEQPGGQSRTQRVPLLRARFRDTCRYLAAPLYLGAAPEQGAVAARRRRVSASAALLAGHCDQSHLCRHFRNTCGMTPGQYISRERSAKAAANCNRQLEAA